ncbi:coproporphyrinogen III oxidase family protein [Nonomuraea sp. K274]|uniref:Heme chaperone HemW n=1 Tax=Nonomuraea cypriaca TaxID=1187855 RepID=A0A931A7C8_9ACTN|nr:coproporphyrinogen-III oxidase family protein [Nonomuraea cypriaca]MBF8184769.1 coproporphyrinogen III oxidase family protein [Nonomuraea cypriaca]
MTSVLPKKHDPLFTLFPPQLSANTAGHGFAHDRLALDEAGRDYVLYLAIPFCRVRCHACPYFNELLSPRDPLDKEERYVSALLEDLRQWASYTRFRTGRLRAIYLGGGTGSIFSTANIKRIVDTIFALFPVAHDYELTLEGNAHDYNKTKLDFVADSQVTRVSLGVQSFDPYILKTIGSPHAADESTRVISELGARGFHNVQLDMMYNLPGQDRETWQRDLNRLDALNISHFTIYLYRIHQNSPQHRFIQIGKVPAILPKESENVRQMYDDVIDAAASMGFQNYMFDYFAKPGYQSEYNNWSLRNASSESLGVGPGAYGYINNHRYATGRNVENYIAAVHRGEHVITGVSEPVSLQAQKERFIINLLQYFVVDLAHYRSAFGTDLTADFASEIEVMSKRGLATLDEEKLTLTLLGKEWHRQRVAYQRTNSGINRELSRNGAPPS